jgi:hypothetical protein
MTAVQQPPLGGDASLRWDANNIDNEPVEEFEDDESNSAKLFERSRIRALAGKLSGELLTTIFYVKRAMFFIVSSQ